MQIKQGIPVSPGVAIGPAVVLGAEDVPVARRSVSAQQVSTELERLDKAIAASRAELEKVREQAASTLGAELAKIFDTHLGMLADKHLIGQFQQIIDSDWVTAEYAVYVVMRRLGNELRAQESKIFRDRAVDIVDLERRIIGHLIGRTTTELARLEEDAIVIAHDLTPSQTASLDPKRIKGLATDAGGRTSHTAILAHAQGIPAVVGLESATSEVNTGDTVIVDGNRGVLIVNPDADRLLEYRQYLRELAVVEGELDQTAHLPAQTLDGTTISIHANIEFPEEIDAAVIKGAAGIGLYRTEFMFMSATATPTEEQQFEAYVKAVRLLKGKPLTIRTLDLGADKMPATSDGQDAEPNPFLGCRSIRLCLQNLPLFKTQLRAILRASHEGPLRIMFPLVSSILELRQAKMILMEVMEDLRDEDIAFDEKVPVGMMVEVPSAAIQAQAFAREVAFFSIGTNDLIQYTIAVDRGNERVARLYSAAHPAVIQLIKEVVRHANRAKIDVSLCGEIGGEPEFVLLLLGLGLRTLSITRPAIPSVKRVIRTVSLKQCQRLARRVGTFDTDREIQNYLREEGRRLAPEVFKSMPE